VRAQLSAYELLLLFYNSITSFGKEKFKPLIEEFHLLKTVPKNLLIDSTHKNFYNETAFSKN
jgi:hypothetical protein